MKYLSLFSGIGGFELGIQKALPNAECVGFSEVDPYPISIYKNRFPDHPDLGPVEAVLPQLKAEFDLLVAGFPCTDLSIANVENKGLDGLRSGLVKEAVAILRERKPRWFLIENVASMKKQNVEAISDLLREDPVLLNAADVSCQRRERLFWANFPIDPLPKIKADLVDVLETDYDPKLVLSEKELVYMNRQVSGGRTHWDFGHHHDTDHAKSHCLPANLHKGVPYNVLIDRRFGKTVHRKLSPLEAERIMGFPDGWTASGDDGKSISNSRRYKALGNAVSIPVVGHIFSCLRKLTESI